MSCKLFPPSKSTVIVVFLMQAAALFGQSNTGLISGFVKDPSSLFVAGASVTATNEANGHVNNATTAETGYYQLPDLPPGYYTLVVRMSGFKRFTVRHVELDAASEASVNATLQVGDINQEIEVAASTAAVQTETAQMGRVVESQQVSEIAVNGRNPMYLPMLTAGVSAGAVAIDNFDPMGLSNQLNINGSRPDSNLITVDGAIATRTRGDDQTLGVYNVDTVSEVQVLTADYLAEYGRAGGGLVRFVTKSGTKDFHGSAWESIRNAALDANTWARNQSGGSLAQKALPFVFNQFGYALGGPVFIPKKWNTDRSKLFFFWSEEFIRWRESVTMSSTVPTSAMDQGDFSQLLQPTNPFFGKATIVNDPTTGQPFPNNVIPKSRFSPNGVALLSAYPLPTPGYQSGALNLIQSEPFPTNARKDFVKVNYLLGTRNTITLSGTNWSSVQVLPYGNGGTSPLGLPCHFNRPARTGVFSVTSTISPTLINEFTMSASEDIVQSTIFSGPGYPSYERSNFGITYPYLFPNSKDVANKIPTISIQNFTTVDATPYPSHSSGPIFSWADNVTKISGNHTIKFGVYIEHSGENDDDQINPAAGVPGSTNNLNGQFSFLNAGDPNGTGVAVANALLGQFNTYTEFGQRDYTIWRSTATDLFAQDGWKVTPRLKLEYGVRYIYWPPWHAEWGNIAMFDPAFYNPADAAVVSRVNGSVISGNVYNGVVLPGNGWPSGAIGRIPAASNPLYNSLFHGLPEGLVATHKDVFEPRFGVAFGLDSKTAIRAGVGMFHNRSPLNSVAPLGGNPPVQPEESVNNGLVDNPAGAASQYPIVETSWDPLFNLPTTWNWNFSTQRELFGGMTLDVAYVGSRSYHLPREANINQLQPGTLQANTGVSVDALRPYQGLGVILQEQYASSSKYNGLQVQLQRRFKSGLGLGLAYTWSKNLDDSSTKRIILPNAYNAHTFWGPSDFDVAQVMHINCIYELPFFKNRTHGLASIAGGWELTVISQIQTGLPLSATTPTDNAGVGVGSAAQYWNVNGPLTPPGGQGFAPSVSTKVYWFNPAAFTVPTPGTFGDAGRNDIWGPGLINIDGGLSKTFAIGEKLKAQLRGELFDLPNHPNLSNPGLNPTAGGFGQVTSKSGNRLVQLSMRLDF